MSHIGLTFVGVYDMALKDVTPDELSIAINLVGAANAAKLGYFHALPYGDSGEPGSGSYGGKMFMSPAMPEPGPPGFYAALFDIGDFIPPLSVVPFTRSVVLNPVDGYVYTTTDYVRPDLRTVDVALRVEWVLGGDDPGTGGNVNIGLKVEPFIVSV